MRHSRIVRSDDELPSSELIRKCIPTTSVATHSRYTQIVANHRRKKGWRMFEDRGEFEMSLLAAVQKFLDEFIREQASASVCASRAKSRANPPAIHRDFRQLTGVIVIEGSSRERKTVKATCDVATVFLHVAFFDSRGFAEVGQPRLPRSRDLIDPLGSMNQLVAKVVARYGNLIEALVRAAGDERSLTNCKSQQRKKSLTKSRSATSYRAGKVALTAAYIMQLHVGEKFA